MNFAEAMKNETIATRTENGAYALNTTGDALVDLFGTIGALRNADENRITTLFAEAFKENPLLATKMLFYARDIRGGLGERRVFRVILKYMAEYHTDAIRKNIKYIPEFGRYDDLYTFVGTPVENDMWKFMKEQWIIDLNAMVGGQPISLLAKWIKTPYSSSKDTSKLGVLTGFKLGYKDTKQFKKTLKKMREYLVIVEKQMTDNKWKQIAYETVPSRASMIYRNAFKRHDEDRYSEFINKAFNGEAKINASTLYPYDIVEKFLNYHSVPNIKTLEAQWKQLPNYVEDGIDAIVMADVSGSMTGRPMATSIGLAIYFAERNKGAYKNMFMTFSSRPQFVYLKGNTLEQKIRNCERADWGMNTNFEAAFKTILNVAIKNKVAPKDMPKSLIVISDMEFDRASCDSWIFYDIMKKEFRRHGYEIPNIVFWNVESRNDVFHADASHKGVQLCSGQSSTIFKQLIKSIGMTPVEMMIKTLDSERYSCINI